MGSYQIIGEINFEGFDRALVQLGWRRDPDLAPVEKAEPAFASWSRPPDGELDYAFNTSLGIRLLALRGEDGSQYLEELEGLVSLASSELSIEALETVHLAGAQLWAYSAIELIQRQVAPLLWALAGDLSGEVVARLRPREGDYPKVFVAGAVSAARQAYADFWNEAPVVDPPGPAQTRLRIYAAPAGMLAGENELSRQFPGGYRPLAPWLVPSRVWLAWKFTEPVETGGLAYNGLVWVDDRWTWFPRPYRLLAPYLSDRTPGSDVGK